MRPKSSGRDLPPRLLRRTKTLRNGTTWVGYYYNGRAEDGRRVEIPLGSDLASAKRQWAELEAQGQTRPAVPVTAPTVGALCDRYERDIISRKASNTQKANRRALGFLRRVFATAPLDQVRPQHIAQYRDARRDQAPVAANRELSLLSHIFTKAREWGLLNGANPCQGIERLPEPPRDYYLDDGVWAALYAVAPPELQDAMDLAYLTGQRPADVLRMRLTDIQDGAIEVRQAKTGHKLRILLTVNGQATDLGRLLERLRSRPRAVGSFYLVALPATGRPLTAVMLQRRVRLARSAAIAAARDPELIARIAQAQFRDIRPKAASEIASLADAADLLGHTEQEITSRVYTRIGKAVKPTR